VRFRFCWAEIDDGNDTSIAIATRQAIIRMPNWINVLSEVVIIAQIMMM
jgi:hypothetical protein